jgi:hypothetical protein
VSSGSSYKPGGHVLRIADCMSPYLRHYITVTPSHTAAAIPGTLPALPVPATPCRTEGGCVWLTACTPASRAQFSRMRRVGTTAPFDDLVKSPGADGGSSNTKLICHTGHASPPRQ